MNVYEIITERISERLENGVIPWRRPWKDAGEPKNLITKKAYRGINWILLSSAGYANPHFLTFKQCKDLGGSVKKGSGGIPVVFWKWGEYEREKESGEKVTENVPILRYYTVFNVEQCEGIDPKKIPSINGRDTLQDIPSAQSIVDGMPARPNIRHLEARAYYQPRLDYVNMPDRGLFIDDEHYYSVLFHELTHSTGHESRLKRHEKSEFEFHYWGDANYAREELVAEMGSAFLMGHVGLSVPDIENTAAYIRSWLKALRNDKRMVVLAAAQAQKAADYIRGVKDEVKP